MFYSKENLIKGIHYESGKTIAVRILDGYIESIQEISAENVTSIIAPGLVDIQINGYIGVDFNSRPLKENEWHKILYHLAKAGVTTLYPTIITNSFEQLAVIFEKNINMLETNTETKKRIGGFHLEGPYISMKNGPRGAHNKKFVRMPDWDEFCMLQEKAQGMIKIVTLSPEWVNAPSFIEKLTENGVKVAIGHTAANSVQIEAAVSAGAVLSTHLGNGAHLNLPRHPNYIWEQLAQEKLWASVISDGNHLPASVLKVMEKVKNGHLILISDSVALAGMKPGDYSTAVGGEVTLTTDGRLHLKNEPELLAGSAQNLLQGIKHFAELGISTEGEAINKASIYPSKFMGLPQKGGLSVGAPADIILIEKSLKEWNIVRTYKDGNQIFQKGGGEHFNSSVL